MSKTDSFDLFAHTRFSPVYYIKDVDKCEDNFALFIYNTMFERVEQILTSRDVIEYYKNTNNNITGFNSINSGHCEDVAGYTYEKIKKSSFSTSRARVLCLFNDNDPRDDNTEHTFIEYTTPDNDVYYFDTLVPWGVQDILHVPRLYQYPWATKFTSTIKEIDPYNDIPNQVAGIYGYINDKHA